MRISFVSFVRISARNSRPSLRWLPQGRIQEFLIGGGGPNFTHYVETVLRLTTSVFTNCSLFSRTLFAVNATK